MKEQTKILNFAWIAFFITFIVWFNLPPLVLEMGLMKSEIKELLLLNVALTIPARVLVGIIVDRYGPRVTYSALLVLSGMLAILFTFASTYGWMQVIRLLQGITGAGFVIGIRLISEWYEHKKIGLMEGIYGGLGNFGAAAAAMSLPLISGYYGGWQSAMVATGLLSILYAFVFYFNVKDFPSGATYHRPVNALLMPTATRTDLIVYSVLNVLMFGTVSLIVWKLHGSWMLHSIIWAACLFTIKRIIDNHGMRTGDEYKMKQVGVLAVSYTATFGSELAVVSMLPIFFAETFNLSLVQAGLVASSFAFMNLVSRASGGSFSDRFGRKRVLTTLLAGVSVGYLGMSFMGEFALIVAIAITMMTSFMVQAGEGAVFAMVPLIKRSLTGQIAGIVGAYGNIGAVIFLTTYVFADVNTFFWLLAFTSLSAAVLAHFYLEEPKGYLTEVMPDGTVIQVCNLSE